MQVEESEGIQDGSVIKSGTGKEGGRVRVRSIPSFQSALAVGTWWNGLCQQSVPLAS